MSIWDRVQQKQAQITEEERGDYFITKPHLMKDPQFTQAINNKEIVDMALADDKDSNVNNLSVLVSMMDTGKKQAIYDVAAYIFLIGYISSEVGIKTNNAEKKEFGSSCLLKTMLLIEEAKRA